jgi:hypothetical protein
MIYGVSALPALPLVDWTLCKYQQSAELQHMLIWFSYGTWDHVVLLVGRVAEFSAKDLKRKRAAMKRPPPGGPGGQKGPPPSMSSLPPFAGMLPDVNRKPTLPRGFSPAREDSPDSVGTDERPLDEQTREAEEEWNEIHHAFKYLEEAFGPDYQPLTAEYSQPIQTPFGPALQYRTFGIAGIWMFHYMGLILLHRAHPSMPPAAMAAVGLAARHTGDYANHIGRIAAAIAPNASEIQQVSTGIGAALMEGSFSLFVAAVQVSFVPYIPSQCCFGSNRAFHGFSTKMLHNVAGRYKDASI